MSIEERLDRLEKQNRNLRRGLIGLLLLAMVALLAAFVWQDKKPRVAKFDTIEAETVRAKKLFASDLELKSGNKEIKLSATSNAATLVLQNSEKLKGIVLSVHDRLSLAPEDIFKRSAGATLFIADDKGGRAWLSADELGSRLGIEDAGLQLRASLGVLLAGGDKSGAKISESRPTLSLYDSKGNVIHQEPK